MPRHRAHSVLRVRFGARRRIFFPLLPTFYLCFRPSPTPRSPSTTQWRLPFLSLLSPFSFHSPVPTCSLSSIIWCFSTGLISPLFLVLLLSLWSIPKTVPTIIFLGYWTIVDLQSSLTKYPPFFASHSILFFSNRSNPPPLPGCRAIVPVGGADEHTTGTEYHFFSRMPQWPTP